MRNKLLNFLREHAMVQPGDTVICAVSGGADSMALLWCMYLLKDKLQIDLQAAHFNHNLRGEESDRDAAFVAAFCEKHGIVCHVGSGRVQAGEKGLEAAARNARYGFLQSLPGKIATAHTADDNAETLLMHLMRGTGLKGLGGIAPVRENLIRPMLTVTRQEVLEFLKNENIPYVNDSSNDTDAYLRNRIRHHVMPLLQEENPCIGKNLSATALRLRQDEQALDAMAEPARDVQTLRRMPAGVQALALSKLLTEFGVKEPEAEHVELLRKVLYSENPSASGDFPGNIRIGRQYDRLIRLQSVPQLGAYVLNCPGNTEIPELGLRVICTLPCENGGFPACVQGKLILRSRAAGDTIRLPGGTKTLKKLFIDQKIPASQRERIPVIADDAGVVLVGERGPVRICPGEPNCRIRVEKM